MRGVIFWLLPGTVVLDLVWELIFSYVRVEEKVQIMTTQGGGLILGQSTGICIFFNTHRDTKDVN